MTIKAMCVLLVTLTISCHPTPKLTYVNPTQLTQQSLAVQAAQRELAAVAAPMQANAGHNRFTPSAC